MHRVAALLPPFLTGSTIFLGQVEPTRAVCHRPALLVCLGVGFELLFHDGIGELGAGAASMDKAKVDHTEDDRHQCGPHGVMSGVW